MLHGSKRPPELFLHGVKIYYNAMARCVRQPDAGMTGDGELGFLPILLPAYLPDLIMVCYIQVPRIIDSYAANRPEGGDLHRTVDFTDTAYRITDNFAIRGHFDNTH